MSNASLVGFAPLATSSPLLVTWIFRDGNRLRLRQGSGGFLLVFLADCFDKSIEDLNEPVLDDWGHAFRAVRGYVSTLSRHAYGLAEDLNATDHPLGADHTFTVQEIREIHTLLERFDGCIRWGGDYEGRKDAMHFEVDKSLEACEKVARRLADTPRGRRILDLNPGQRKVIFS